MQLQQAPPLTERDFTRQVRELAELRGWRYFHAWLSIHSPRGFPDVVLARPPRLLLVELKTERGKVSEAQREWLQLLGQCPGVECHLWRPSAFDEIERVLR